MAYKPISIDGILASGVAQVVRAAAGGGAVGTNERIVIKRLRITQVLADGGATATIDLWKGTANSDAFRERRSMSLTPGQVEEWDPTFMVLEPGESLNWLCTPANSCSIAGDGALQNE